MGVLKVSATVLGVLLLCCATSLFAETENNEKTIVTATATISFMNSELTESNCSVDKAILFEGEKLKIKVDITGLSKRGMVYNYYWTTAGFKENVKGLKANSRRTRRSRITIKIPDLQRSAESATMILSVRARNRYGEEAIAVKSIRVWRQFYVLQGDMKRQCMSVLAPELISGMYTNHTNASRTIHHSDKTIWTSSESSGHRRGWGFNLSPSYAGIALFSFGKSFDYLSNKGRSIETQQSSEISTELFPGEAAFFFRQSTLLNRHFKVYMIERCQVSRFVGDAFYHSSVHTYPVAMVDSQSKNPLKDVSVGSLKMDGCKGFEASLTDEEEDAFINPNEGETEVPFEG